MTFQCAASGSGSKGVSGTQLNAATVAKWEIRQLVIGLHKGLPLLRLLLLLLLLTTGVSASEQYSFDEHEIASTANLSLPLPRPFDAAACSFNHIVQQQQLLQALQQLQPSASRGLRQDASVEALLEAAQSGLVVEEADRSITFGRQAEVTVKLKFNNRGKSPISSVFILLPYSDATQLGWIDVSTHDDKHLAVQSVLPPLPSISSLRWEDWGLRPLLLEQTEQHLKKASEGQGNAFVSPCWPHVFRIQLEELLPVSKSTILTVSYLLGSSHINTTLRRCVSILNFSSRKCQRNREGEVQNVNGTPPTAAGRPYRPLPRSLDLESIQSVVFATSSNWPLPYKTLRSTLSLQLPPITTLGETGERHMLKKSFRKLPGEVWKWESNDPFDPLKIQQPFAVVFPLPEHLGYVLTMERLLVAPVSGSAFCKDLYKIHNDAALQEGPFNPITIALLQGLPPGISRLAANSKDVPRNQRVPTHVLFDLHATLPPDVFNLDVGDSAGNLTSTFAARDGPKEAPLSTHLEVWPRFPVLGGWNFDLTVSYEVPVSSLVLQKGLRNNSVSLNIPLEPPFLDLYAENISLTVALPTGATNIQYSSPVDFESVEETTIKWWLDIVTSRPALRLKWHSASLTPTQHKARSLTVTFDYPYSLDLEYLKKAFGLLLLVLIIAIATVLYRWKTRPSTTKKEAPAATLPDAFEQVQKELWRKTEAAICEGRVCMDSVAAYRSQQTSLKQKRPHEEEKRWTESMRQHEVDIVALLRTVPDASSSVIAFKKALARYQEAVQAYITALPNDCRDKAEEANQEVEASAEHLRVLARGLKGSSSKQHEA
ncbi:ribophorin I, putative [Eimeria brunetti]|uniref:Dolichyl-diphosphooligosaccharide--protein glycosyltransferase subunit 1 n=1 Tax=Eimeria brunetti TaxID=51314 RepID=U6M006_9EIME|nr:ribophorin I, putative [Eimeria brunetti]